MSLFLLRVFIQIDAQNNAVLKRLRKHIDECTETLDEMPLLDRSKIDEEVDEMEMESDEEEAREERRYVQFAYV